MRIVEVPATPPALAPGRSAIGWARLQLRTLAVMIGSSLAMGVFTALAPSDESRHFLVYAALVVGIGGALGLLVASVQRTRVSLREYYAGYTTLWHRQYRLWQLDEKTGEVLRRPGEREAIRRR